MYKNYDIFYMICIVCIDAARYAGWNQIAITFLLYCVLGCEEYRKWLMISLFNKLHSRLFVSLFLLFYNTLWLFPFPFELGLVGFWVFSSLELKEKNCWCDACERVQKSSNTRWISKSLQLAGTNDDYGDLEFLYFLRTLEHTRMLAQRVYRSRNPQ